MARQKKNQPVVEEPVESIEVKEIEPMQMVKKINLDKFKNVYGTVLPHVVYVNGTRYRIDSDELDSKSKLYMVLKKAGVVDAE